jgi:hypothetical protein
MTSNELEDRLERLRSEWPAGSIVSDVMARIGPADGPVAASGPRRRWRRAAVGLVAAGLLAASVLALMSLVGHSNPVQAAIQEALARARSARIVVTAGGKSGAADPAEMEIWYLRDRGLRAELPDEVMVDDGRSFRSWHRAERDEEPIVVVRKSTGAAARIAELLGLAGSLDRWDRRQAADLDRVINGFPCRADVLVPPEGGPPEPGVPPGARPVAKHPTRLVVLTDAERRMRQLLIQQQVEGRWISDREMRIEYDVPVDAARLAAGLPAGARTVDADTAFDERHPLDRALVRKELGGLMLAIHEVRPLDRDGVYYVVSSVRGTSEFLRKYPPRRRFKNLSESVLDVADQQSSVCGTAFRRLVLAVAEREGVQYTWWLILPRWPAEMGDDERARLRAMFGGSPSEPLRLQVAPGKIRLPLEATYRDPRFRDAQGMPRAVQEWVDIDLPGTLSPMGLEGVAARTRGDLRLMQYGSDSALYGIADEGSPSGPHGAPKGITAFEPDRITNGAYAAAVRRWIDEARSQNSP